MHLRSSSAPVRIGLIGSGWIGGFHAESLAYRIPGARLAAIADPATDSAERLAEKLGCNTTFSAATDLIEDPDIEAVVIAAPPRTHAQLTVAAAQAGKAVFCEKPMALTLADADRAISAARTAGVPLQIGFNRRFAADFHAAHGVIASGGIGTPQLLRSLTRDPGLSDPAAIKPWTIFLETLIHDFDTLRWLNPGAEAVEVFATADALVRPDWRERGLLDTAVVLVRFDNGAIATAEASFQASYGYDVRGEVFGAAGMVSAGEIRSSAMTRYDAQGVSMDTVRLNIDLFRDAYTAELSHFVDCVRSGRPPEVTGEDARAALAIALAAIASVQRNEPVRLADIERS